MITARLMFAGFGRRAVELAAAIFLLAVAATVIAASTMVVRGAQNALHRLAAEQRPDIVQVKARFNRALFETPRSGSMPASTLPVYEPLIDPRALQRAAAGATVVARQSLLQNTVSGDRFLNLYLFGIDPVQEAGLSRFPLARGRFLRPGDINKVVLDEASARAVGVDLGGAFTVRRADGTDARLIVVGILREERLQAPPPSTIEAPAAQPGLPYVSSGALVTLPTSREIFDRDTLTDALVVARNVNDVPALAGRLREAFRLEPGVFVTQSYDRFRRQVGDFRLTLALFGTVALFTAVTAGAFAIFLLRDIHRDRQSQYDLLLALGFTPARVLAQLAGFGVAVAVIGAMAGLIAGIALCPAAFAMPSLMADLGAVTPRLDALAAAAPFLVGIIATLAGAGPSAAAILGGRHSWR